MKNCNILGWKWLCESLFLRIPVARTSSPKQVVRSWTLHHGHPLTNDRDRWHHHFGRTTNVCFKKQKLIFDDVHKIKKIKSSFNFKCKWELTIHIRTWHGIFNGLLLKPGPRKTWTLRNLDWKTWTLKNLDPEKHKSWNHRINMELKVCLTLESYVL